MNQLFFALFACCALTSFSQQTFTDARDGSTYSYTKLGNLYWMTEDLRYPAEGSRCLEACDSIRFYDYRFLTEICPKGWRLPTMNEWDHFVNSFEAAEKVRMLATKTKVYRVDFLDQFNIFQQNVLNLKAYGRMEGGKFHSGNFIDYWTDNPESDDRFHMHFTPYSIMGHSHKHHLRENKEEDFRMFPVRCVCTAVDR